MFNNNNNNNNKIIISKIISLCEDEHTMPCHSKKTLLKHLLKAHIIGKSVPLQARGVRGFQEVKVPRLRDNGPGWW